MTDFEKFRALVFENPELQRRLLAEPDAGRFADLLIAEARERGFEITKTEIQEALQQARRAWFERHVA